MILALDFGRELGICFGERGAPALRTAMLPKKLGALLSDFEGLVRGLFAEIHPSLVVYETPFINLKAKHYGAELRIVQRVFGQSGAVHRLCHDFGLPEPPHYVAPTVRARYCGSKKADEDAIMLACRALGARPSTNHEADAFLVWIAACDDAKKQALLA